MPLDRGTLALCAKALSQLEVPADGSLTRRELQDILQGILGSPATQEMVYSLMVEIEEDCSGQLEDVWVALGGDAEALEQPIPFQKLLGAFKDHFSMDVDEQVSKKKEGGEGGPPLIRQIRGSPVIKQLRGPSYQASEGGPLELPGAQSGGPLGEGPPALFRQIREGPERGPGGGPR
ncbi:hypothetical protein Esti_005596 [Eimeria stiedai]